MTLRSVSYSDGGHVSSSIRCDKMALSSYLDAEDLEGIVPVVVIIE